MADAQRAREQNVAHQVAEDQTKRLAAFKPVVGPGDGLFKAPEVNYEQSAQEKAMRREHVSNVWNNSVITVLK